jgi:hypothetical protein
VGVVHRGLGRLWILRGERAGLTPEMVLIGD